MKSICCAVFLLFLFGSTNANPDSLQAVEWVQLSLKKLKQQEDSAAIYRQKALDIFAANDDLVNWQKVLQSTGTHFRKQDAPYRAIGFYTTALYHAPREPQTPAEWKRRAILFNQLAYTHKKLLGDLKGAQQYYEASKSIYGDTTKMAAGHPQYVYGELGTIYTRLGQYDKALYHLTVNRDYFIAKNNSRKLANTYSDLGMMYNAQGAFQTAIDQYNQGLELDELPLDSRINLLLNIVLAHYNVADYSQARAINEQVAQMVPDDDVGWQMTLHENEALISQALGQYEKAAAAYRALLGLATANPSNKPDRSLAQYYLNFGQLYQEWGNPGEALALFQNALQAVLPSFEYSDDWQNPDPATFYPEKRIAQALEGKADALQALAIAPSTQKALSRVLDTYELATSAQESLRGIYQFDSAKLDAQEINIKRSRNAIAVAFQLWQMTGKQDYIERAFRISEKSRAQVLLDRLQNTLARNARPIDDAQQKRGYQLGIDRAYLEKKLQDLLSEGTLVDQQLLQETHEQLNEVKEQQAEWEQAGESNANRIPTLSISKVKEMLHPKQALLQYFMGTEMAYLFVFTKDSSHFLECVLVDDYQQDFRQFIKSIKTKSLRTSPEGKALFRDKGHRIFKHFLKNALSRLDPTIDQLTIIPDGGLSYIPFDILLTSTNEQRDFRQLPYLMNEYRISYAYSASLLHRLSAIPAGRAAQGFLGFAPDYETRPIAQNDTLTNNALALLVRSGQYALKGTEEEVRAIAQTWHGTTRKSRQATEANFKKEASDYRVLQLAMHALVDDQNPLLSRLLFSAQDTVEDGNLTMAELLLLPLKADLAVLSACETGVGQIKTGEGVMSLARAFHAIGIPSTIVTLWKVPDETTTGLMIDFHQQLALGQTKDEALHQAKLNHLQHPETTVISAHPYYWAGFIPTGNMMPIPSKSGFSRWWYLLLGIPMILGFYFFRKKTD